MGDAADAKDFAEEDGVEEAGEDDGDGEEEEQVPEGGEVGEDGHFYQD